MRHFIQRRIGIFSGFFYFVGMTAFFVWRGHHPVAFAIGSAFGAGLFGVMMSMSFKAMQSGRETDESL